ncbi:Calmodulin-binding transcription activator [Carabus blaptoides fortunei]
MQSCTVKKRHTYMKWACFFTSSEDEPDINNELEISTAETVEAIVSQLMEKQRAARQAALVKQLECGCPDSSCAADGKQCSHPIRRIRGADLPTVATKIPQREDSNQVSSTTGCGKKNGGAGGMTNSHSPRIYARDSRIHHQTSTHQNSTTSTPPLVLSLSQIQGGGGLLLLNSSANTSTHTSSHQSLVSPVAVTSFVCSAGSKKNQTLVLKQEAMDTNTNCLHANESLNKMDITNGNISELYESLTFNKHHLHQASELVAMSNHSTPSKRMDTSGDIKNYCAETVVLLGTDNGNKNDINSGFFNETLDLSHEDIQRTLSANMPMCELEQNSGHNQPGPGRESHIPSKQVDEVGQDTGVIVSEMNPMDFMDGADIVVSPTHVVDDDVFVNLDAFDMLGEFPELEVLDGSATNALLDVTNAVGPPEASSGDKTTEQQSPHMDYREGTANITDYSPGWAYPEGGVKVLVTGPWYSTSSPYTVLFDTFPVPTTLVQSGVLRCYCPAHEAGLATLQVASEGFVISNSVIFEYKVPPHEEGSATTEAKVERGSDNLLKFTLLHRLEAMDDRLQIKQEPEGNDGLAAISPMLTPQAMRSWAACVAS